MRAMPARFDHAVIIVPSLTPAVRRFERLGFRVVVGGRTGPVHNALILFGDGAYLELTTNRFAALRPLYRALNTLGVMRRVAAKRDDMLQRFLPWIGARQGAIDWCLRVDDIRATISALRAAGVDMVDEMPFERERPDGEVAKWMLAGPRDPSLPFLIEDLTPVEIRVPYKEHSSHPNGVAGIRRIVLPSVSKDAFEETMARTLRPDAPTTGHDLDVLGSVRTGGSDPAGEIEGRFALELLRPGHNDEELDANLTCGVAIKLTARI